MYSGGSLNPNKTFKKILSIGYEFESHDLAKLSLHNNSRTLVNSDIALRIIPTQIEKESIKIADNHYLFVRIPIHDDEEKPKPKKEPTPKKDPVEDEDDELAELQEEFEQEFDEEDEMDELEREFLEEFEEENEREALALRENESYLEYFNENRKRESAQNTKFQITNDLAEGDFLEMVKKECEGKDIHKNKLFYFKTNHGKLFDIKFSEPITDDCYTFSGVEYVVTYYKPKQKNSNIIIDTFVDACSRILDHFGDMEKTAGSLLIKTGEDKYDTIGNLGDKRALYHKPRTNLFYMSTYDDGDWKTTRPPKGLGDATFSPQMTFRCKSADLIDIMKEIMRADPGFKIGKASIKGVKDEYDYLIILEKVINGLFVAFNKKATKKINGNSVMGKILKTYVFMIFYKIYMYIEGHIGIKFQGYYLKDFIGFSSRHTNYDLYVRVKEILKEHYGVEDLKEVHAFFYQPDVLKPLYEFKKFEEEDYDENGDFVFGEPLTTELPKKNKNYGDPMYSISSYFYHFENSPANAADDWFLASRLDVFSTTFELHNDEILVENRYFKAEIGLWLRNHVDKGIHTSYITVKDMYKFAEKFLGENVKKLMTLEQKPNSQKLTKKCKRGFVRGKQGTCIKTKKAVAKTRIQKTKTRKQTLESITSVQI